jgi:hypothetical protein
MMASVAQSGLKRSMLPHHDLPDDRQLLVFNSCVPGDQRRSGKPEPGWQAGRAPTPRPPQPSATRVTTTTAPRTPLRERPGCLDQGTGPGSTPAHPRAAARARAPAEQPRVGACPATRRGGTRPRERNRSRRLAGKNARNQSARLMAAVRALGRYSCREQVRGHLSRNQHVPGTLDLARSGRKTAACPSRCYARRSP